MNPLTTPPAALIELIKRPLKAVPQGAPMGIASCETPSDPVSAAPPKAAQQEVSVSLPVFLPEAPAGAATEPATAAPVFSTEDSVSPRAESLGAQSAADLYCESWASRVLSPISRCIPCAGFAKPGMTKSTGNWIGRNGPAAGLSSTR